MLIIRRSYFTSKLPKFPLPEQTSIGKFVRSSKKSCPRRNRILGENFCRFTVRTNVFTAANNDERNDPNALHCKYVEAIRGLDFVESVSSNDDDRLKLPSTGQLISESVYNSLSTWKRNARHEIQKLYDGNIDEDAITENVRGLNHSLIGWYLQTYGMENTMAFIRWLGVPLQEFPSNVRILSEVNGVEEQRRINELLDGYEALEQKINYQFRNRAVLLQAISDSTFTANNLTPNYQGLDFIGDAVTNYLIIRHLFRQPRRLTANELEDASKLLYCDSCYATVSIRNGMHKFLRYTSPDIRSNINSFEAYLRKNRFRPVTDSYFLDRGNVVFEVPTIIPSTFEALMGAAYLDSDMDLNVVSNIITTLMHPDIKQVCERKSKSALTELRHLDPDAQYSKPETIAPGKIQVTVCLPKYENRCFSGYSKDEKAAKWAAAKAAIIWSGRQKNAFIPVKHKELYRQYKETQ